MKLAPAPFRPQQLKQRFMRSTPGVSTIKFTTESNVTMPRFPVAVATLILGVSTLVFGILPDAAFGQSAPRAQQGSESRQLLPVPGEIYPGALRPAARSARLKLGASAAPSSFEIELGPPPEEPPELRTLLRAPLKIGTNRLIPAPQDRVLSTADFVWSDVPEGGRAARFTVSSEGAVAIRLALGFVQVPVGVEIRFFSVANPGARFGPYTSIELVPPGGEPFWSPVVEGSMIGVEIFAAEQDAASLSFSVTTASHLEYAPMNPLPMSLSGIGRAQCTQVDLSCDPAWQTAGDAVAKIIFTTGAGTFLCSGQLMNDTDASTTIPYFSTANHCVGAQSVASTINFFWFFQRAQCGGPAPTAVVQTTDGAQLLATSGVDTGTDFTLLRLHQAPPAGVSLSGWDAQALTTTTAVRGVHHPRGDLKKITTGSVTGFRPWTSQAFDSHVDVNYSSGTTEGGSSGSGLWRGSAFPQQYLTGVLTGGPVQACLFTRGIYGRFDLTYPSIQQWLDPGTSSPPPPAPPGAPTPLSPTGTTDDSTPEYRWSEVTGAAEYGVTLSIDASGRNGISYGPEWFDAASACSSGTCAAELTIAGATPLQSGVTYTWQVLARNSAGTSPASAPLAFRVVPASPPTAPTGLLATPTTTRRIDLRWTDTSATETSFNLQRRNQGSSVWARIASPAANTTSYADRSLPTGTYCYRIRAEGTAGNSSYATSTPECLAIGVAPTPPSATPAAPTNLIASAVSGRVVLTWIDNASIETRFKLQRRVGGSSTWMRLATSPPNATVYTDGGMPAGTYCYRIRADGSAGSSPYTLSSPNCVAVGGAAPAPAGAPAAPASFTASVVTAGRVDLSWIDKASTEKGFKMQRRAAGGAWKAIWIKRDQTAYSDTGLASGNYCYRIRSYNANGNSAWVLSSPSCVSASGTSPPAPLGPAAPSSLVATTLSPGRIHLSWIDNALDEKGFKMQRRLVGGSWSATWIRRNRTAFTDRGLAAGTYCYRIRSYNPSGNSSYTLASPMCVTTTALEPPDLP